MTSTELNDLVADGIIADWGHIKNGIKILARQANISINTLKGIIQRDHGVSLKTASSLAPHSPTLKANLAVIFGFAPTASTEAKRLQLIEAIMKGAHDDKFESFYTKPIEGQQVELMFH